MAETNRRICGDRVKVGIFQEAHVPTGGTVHERWPEVIEEAILADKLGFDFFGLSEEHFGGMEIDGHELATSSTPEVMHSFIAARTSRINLRPMSVNLISINHPVRVAEQLAAIDVLSGGRAQLGGARSNNPWTLEAFGIDADNTRERRNEALEVIVAALSEEYFEFHGEYYDIPRRRLVPRPVQSPYPPIYLAATGVQSLQEAGSMGLGVMTGNTSAGWEYAQECIEAYRQAIAEPDPLGPGINDSFGVMSTAVACAPVRADAFNDARPVALRWMEAMLQLHTVLADKASDSARLTNSRKLESRATDIEYIVDSSPYITVGTPEFFIERARQLSAMGADEWILRIDGMGHEANLRTIEILGREVLPEVHRLTRSGTQPVSAESRRASPTSGPAVS